MDANVKMVAWDWKEQPPLAEIARLVREVSGGKVHLAEVETGGDMYALAVADHEPTAEELQAAAENWR